MSHFEAIERGLGLEGRYRIEAPIAKGGMGSVYRAWQTGLERPVALKHLKPELSGSLDLVQRFLAEARLAARISHPNVVRVLDSGSGPAGLYIVYELIEGKSLRVLMKARLAPAKAFELLGQAALALGAVHDAGAVHRDVKPENMLVDRDDKLSLTDLGIAKDLTSASLRTAMGVLFGTPAYMSPEQCRGEIVGPASDLYSLGVVVYEALTGETPFVSDSPGELLRGHLEARPRPPSSIDPALPAACDALVMRALEKEPGARFRSARELADALESLSATVGELAPQDGRQRRKAARGDVGGPVSSPTASLASMETSQASVSAMRDLSSRRRPAAETRFSSSAALPAASNRRFKTWLVTGLAALLALMMAAALQLSRTPEVALPQRPPSPRARPAVSATPQARPHSSPVPARPAVPGVPPQISARFQGILASDTVLKGVIDLSAVRTPSASSTVVPVELLVLASGQILAPVLQVNVPAGSLDAPTPGQVSFRVRMEGRKSPVVALVARSGVQGAGGADRTWAAGLDPSWLREGFNVLELEVAGAVLKRLDGCQVRLAFRRPDGFPRISRGNSPADRLQDCDLSGDWHGDYWRVGEKSGKEAALSFARDLLKRMPRCVAAWLLLADALARQLPDQSDLTSGGGLIEEEVGGAVTAGNSRREVRSILNHALDLDRESSSVWYRIGAVAQRLGDRDNALRALIWSLLHSPANGVGWHRMAWLEFAALRFTPAAERTGFWRSRCRTALELVEQALARLSHLPHDLSVSLYLKADLLALLGHNAEAREVKKAAAAAQRKR